MKIQYPAAWKEVRVLNINPGFSLGDFLFFRYDVLGYRNGLSGGGIRRIIQAILVSLAYGMMLACLVTLVRSEINDLSVANFQRNFRFPMSYVSTLFGFTAVLEIGSYYQKWRYLADLFNSVIKLEATPLFEGGTKKYSPREHLTACLAMDILIMEMWAHRSYAPIFLETLEKAILVRSGLNINYFYADLNSMAANSPQKFEAIKEVLSNYIEYTRSPYDRIEALINTPTNTME